MNAKFKSENYSAFGGINNKVSAYDNTVFEFLNIINFDFQTPGSLTGRWGSTQYVTQTFGAPITQIYEYVKLSGASFLMIGHSGGQWFGATTGQSQGMSFTTLGATLSLTTPLFPHAQPQGGASFLFGFGGPYYLGDPLKRIVYGGCFIVTDNPGPNGPNVLDQETFVDRLFYCDSQKFHKFDGVTSTTVGLLPPIFAAFSMTMNNAAAAGGIGIGAMTLAAYWFYASYVNDRGFESNIWPVAFYDNVGYAGATDAPIPGSLGGSFVQAFLDLYTPQIYGISTINIYSYVSATLTNATNVAAPLTVWSPNYVLINSVPASGGPTTRVLLGTTAGNFSNFMANLGTQPNLNANSYLPHLGITALLSGQRFGSAAITEIDTLSFYPSILEIYKNLMMCAGFSLSPSTVKFSDPAEPEGYRAESSFEVRTNDGDYITALKAYSTRVFIFKRNSFHSLTGDGATNFFLQEVSLSYGALNKLCVVNYNDILLFLDRKGLIEYGGAQITVVSTKVQSFFDRMNYNVALKTACMVHDKLRNQILIGIPLDNSQVNNITMVFDYLTKAWTTYDGFNPSLFAQVMGRNVTKNAFYGTPSGTVNWFGPSFLGDNGVGFSMYFKTSFLKDMGNSVEKQFRRLYIDATSGSTYVMPINFFQDYGSSKVLQTTMVIGQFQNRIDFGIPAKALAYELSSFQTSSALQINGFTVESRLQRKV